MQKLQAITHRERIQQIDVIRGVAIFGILLVNMAHFSYPDLYLSMIGSENFFTTNWSGLDDWTVTFLNSFIQMKFIMMFSFLFGFGMILMKERAEAKSERFGRIYVRRLLALLLFGTIHAFFIWDGDILMDYALLGFVLLLFQKCKPKTLLIWAVVLYVLFTVPIVLQEISTGQQNEGVNEWQADMMLENKQAAKQALQTYSSGSFVEIAKQRIADRFYYMSLNGMASFNPIVYFFANIPYFSMFLLGAYFAKRKILHEPRIHKDLLKRLWWCSLFIGLPSNLLYGMMENEVFLVIGAPFFMLFYIISIALLMESSLGKRLLIPLAAVGRTAFTNYILQSIVATTIFYSYGLGLYGRVNPFIGLFISILMFTLQLAISNYWLRYFQYGPLEWIWRIATYKAIPRFRVEQNSWNDTLLRYCSPSIHL